MSASEWSPIIFQWIGICYLSDSSSEICNESRYSDVVIIPPDADEVTDEEYLDDDILHDRLPFPKKDSAVNELHATKSFTTKVGTVGRKLRRGGKSPFQLTIWRLFLKKFKIWS